jgi:hypothetical protein
VRASVLALPDAVPGVTTAAPEALRRLADLAQETLGRQPMAEDWCDEAPAEHLLKALGHLSAAGNFVPLLTDGTLTAPDRALLQAHCARAAIFLALLAFQPVD